MKTVSFLESENPPKIPKYQKTLRLHELVLKVRANFPLLSCDTSHEPNGNCSEERVQMNLAILGGFFRVDLPPLIFAYS